MEPSAVAANRGHRARQAGSKYAKKQAVLKKRRGDGEGPTAAQRKNTKAFGVAKVGRANKAMQRKLDLGHRADHAPVTDRKAEAAPPIVVAIMGPPRSGKTTLIKVRAQVDWLAVARALASRKAGRKQLSRDYCATTPSCGRRTHLPARTPLLRTLSRSLTHTCARAVFGQENHQTASARHARPHHRRRK